jgi:hypothetical protein
MNVNGIRIFRKDGVVKTMAFQLTADGKVADGQDAADMFPFQLWIGDVFLRGFETAARALNGHRSGMSIRTRESADSQLLRGEMKRQRERRAELTAIIARLSDEHEVKAMGLSKWARPFLEVSDELADARLELSCLYSDISYERAAARAHKRRTN